jgi:hypothetical protein
MKKNGFEEMGGDLVVRIKEFNEYVEISKSQRKQYKKNEKGKYIYQDGMKILKNPNSVGKPKLKKISGQDMYSGMNQHTRSKMISYIKKYLYEHFRGATPIKNYPVQIELIVKQTETVYKRKPRGEGFYNSNMLWDLDNFTLIWRKAMSDALCGNVEYVKKESEIPGKKPRYYPNREKYPPVLEEDNVIYIQRWVETYKKVDTPEERELIFIISQLDKKLYYYERV